MLKFSWAFLAILGLVAAAPAQASKPFGLACLSWLWPKSKKPVRVGVSSSERQKFAEDLIKTTEEILALKLPKDQQNKALLELQQKTWQRHSQVFWPQYRQLMRDNYLKILQGDLSESFLGLHEVNWQHAAKDAPPATAWQIADLEGFLSFYANLVHHAQARQFRAIYMEQTWADKFFAFNLKPWLTASTVAKIGGRLNDFFATHQVEAIKQQLPADWLLDNLPRSLKLIYIQSLKAQESLVENNAAKNAKSLLLRWLRQDLSQVFKGVPDSDKAYYRVLITKIYSNNFSSNLLEYLGQEFARFNFLSVRQKPMDFMAQKNIIAALGKIIFDPLYDTIIDPSVGESFYGQVMHTAATWAFSDRDSTVAAAQIDEEKINQVIHEGLMLRDEYVKNPLSYRQLDANRLGQMHQFWGYLKEFLPPNCFAQHQWDTCAPFWAKYRYKDRD